MKPTKILLTVGEMAARLGITGSTLLSWYHEGKIPAEIAEGGLYRFNEDSVIEAVKFRKARMEEFYASRQAALAAGAKLWNLPGSTQFREKMDAELIGKRVRETEEALVEKEIPIPSAPIKSNVNRLPQWAMVI